VQKARSLPFIHDITTDTTFWFGFKDDVVIRIRGDAGSSELDIRSKSRVGRSDVGANAERIRRYVSVLQG
jgi:uncharacterized protein (DUF1499 family)